MNRKSSKKMRDINPFKVILILTIVMLVLGLIYIFIFDKETDTVVNIIEVIILPLSLGATAFTIFINNKNQETSIELEKIKMTNDFIKKFRVAMTNFSIHAFIKEEYYGGDKYVKEVYEKIKQQDRLEFTQEFLESLLPDQLSFEELNNYVTVTLDEKNKNIDNFVEICSNFGIVDTYASPQPFHVKTRTFKSNVKKINKKADDRKEEIKQISYNKKKHLESNEALRKKELKLAKLLYAKSIREDDAELLNDMECLLFNVNFDMLNYEQLFHLIIDPFKNYIQSFYLDICFSVVNGKKRNRLLFSNIVEFYNIMMDLEDEYTSGLRKKREDYSKRIYLHDMRHKKPIK